MHQLPIDIVRLDERIPLPEYKTQGAAGLDLCSTERLWIPPHARRRIGTGIAMAIPIGYVGKIFPRSGIAYDKGLVAMDGTIDCDYRGEIRVVLVNIDDHEQAIAVGDRVAQLVIMPCATAQLNVVDRLDVTKRGTSGFGSTGR